MWGHPDSWVRSNLKQINVGVIWFSWPQTLQHGLEASCSYLTYLCCLWGVLATATKRKTLTSKWWRSKCRNVYAATSSATSWPTAKEGTVEFRVSFSGLQDANIWRCRSAQKLYSVARKQRLISMPVDSSHDLLVTAAAHIPFDRGCQRLSNIPKVNWYQVYLHLTVRPIFWHTFWFQLSVFCVNSALLWQHPVTWSRWIWRSCTRYTP